jgi:SHAQKYF class myb-like DNA-binding protein
MDPYMNHMYRTSNMGMGALPGGQPGGPQGGSMGNVQQPAATHATDTTEEDGDADGAARAIKRPRLVWTAQLHKRFEEAIQKLGENRAVPKSIMQVSTLVRSLCQCLCHQSWYQLHGLGWRDLTSSSAIRMELCSPCALLCQNERWLENTMLSWCCAGDERGGADT